MMHEENSISNVTQIEISLYGDKYRPEIDSEIREGMQSKLGVPVFVEGTWRPACGPGLSFSIDLSFLIDGIAFELVKLVITQSIKFIKNACTEPCLEWINITMPSYRVRIASESFDAKCFKYIDYEPLLRDIDSFVAAEKTNGRFVRAVSVPCDVTVADDGRFKADLKGRNRNYLLWYIKYKNNGNYLDCVYDAANNERIEIYGHDGSSKHDFDNFEMIDDSLYFCEKNCTKWDFEE